jgi:hypothetical protein
MEEGRFGRGQVLESEKLVGERQAVTPAENDGWSSAIPPMAAAVVTQHISEQRLKPK